MTESNSNRIPLESDACFLTSFLPLHVKKIHECQNSLWPISLQVHIGLFMQFLSMLKLKNDYAER